MREATSRLRRRAGYLHAAGLAAPAHVDLRLDDDTSHLFCRLGDLLRRSGHHALWHRHALLAE